MRLLKRMLCGRHERRPRHLEACADCRLRHRRERQYLERLRGADVPAASTELTARLLANTEELARREADAPGPAGGLRPALRAAALVAGTAAAASALLAGSAYLMGGTTPALSGGASASVFPPRGTAAPSSAPWAGSGAGPGATSDAPAPADADTGGRTALGWSLTGEPDFTPAGALTAAQLGALRSEGWTCPELRELGYHLVWARAGAVAGSDVLELRLTDGRNFATVLEQHPGAGSVPPGSAAPPGPAAPEPVNVLTGRPAGSDGFLPAALPQPGPRAGGPGPGAGPGVLWVRHAAPYTAIYQSGDATFTYVSDLPAERADDGVAALVQARSAPDVRDHGEDTGDGGGNGFAARLERGAGRVLDLLAP